jgi:predicted dehydrogenase
MLKVAVAGCGYWGPNLVRNFRAVNDCEVKTICDRDIERLAHIKGLYPEVGSTTDFNDVIEDAEIGAVAIATPVSTHFNLALKSLKAGKHTFIEKPMAASTTECTQLIATAEEMGLTLAVGHTFIYSTVVRKIKEIIDNHDIGEVLYISSRRLNLGLFQKDINVAWDLAPHDISIILYLLGEAPLFVNCQGMAHIRDGIEDVTNMSLTFARGSFATVQSSWLDPSKTREMIIVGSKRMIVYDDVEQIEKIRIYDKRVEAPPHYDTFAEFHYSYHHGDMYAPYLRQIEPLKVECGHFIDCIKTGAKPVTGGLEGLRVVQVIEAACESLKNSGSKIAIPDLTTTLKMSMNGNGDHAKGAAGAAPVFERADPVPHAK